MRSKPFPPEQCQDLERRIRETRAEIARLKRQIPGTQGAALQSLLAQIDNREADLQLYEEDYAWGGCGLVDPPPVPPQRVRIRTFEATQAVQTAMNEIQLVAGKPTAVRVYIDHPYPGGSLTGTLYAPAHLEEAADTLNGPIPGRRADDIVRVAIDHTLNFRIPGERCFGRLQCRLFVNDPSHPFDPLYKDFLEFTLNFVPVPNLRLWAYLVHYIGPDPAGNPMNVAAPSADDLRDTMEFVEKTYPIAEITYRVIHEIDFDQNLASGGSSCGLGWDALLARLRGIRGFTQLLASQAGLDVIGSHDVFTALVPTGAPRFCAAGSCVGGCGQAGGSAAAINLRGDAIAQEIAHGLGRAHAPGCNAPAPDPNYPHVDPTWSIYEVGLDVTDNVLHDPFIRADFMSYCRPAWVSPYTYLGLMAALRSQTGGADPVPREADEHTHDMLYLTFRLSREGEVALGPSFHLTGPGLPQEIRPQSNVTVELIARGEIVAFQRCHVQAPAYYDPDQPYTSFDEMLPWFEDLAEIVVRRDGQECARIKVEAKAPRLSHPTVESDGEMLRLNWQPIAGTANSEPHYAVLYSNDGGKSWRPLDFGLTRNSFTVKTRYLAGGEDCRFRVLASAGVRTSSAESKSFVVPRKGPQALIKDLNLARSLGEGKDVTLEGSAFSPETGSIDSGDLVWTSNLDGKIGTGRRISTAKLSVGRHLITLTATGPDGGQSTSQTMVQVTRNSA